MCAFGFGYGAFGCPKNNGRPLGLATSRAFSPLTEALARPVAVGRWAF